MYSQLLIILALTLFQPTITLNANQTTYNQIHVWGTSTYLNPFIVIKLYHDINNSLGSQITQTIVHVNSTNQYSTILTLPNTVLTGYYFVVIDKPVQLKVQLYIATPI